MLNNHTIEDCLEILAGFRKESDGFALIKEDYTIMYSIAKQVFKGTALTDRQFALMQTKLLSYSDQFNKADIPLELNNLKTFAFTLIVWVHFCISGGKNTLLKKFLKNHKTSLNRHLRPPLVRKCFN